MAYFHLQCSFMALISSFFWYCVTNTSRKVDNVALDPHVRQIARGNRDGYRIIAWVFTGLTLFYALYGFVLRSFLR